MYKTIWHPFVAQKVYYFNIYSSDKKLWSAMNAWSNCDLAQWLSRKFTVPTDYINFYGPEHEPIEYYVMPRIDVLRNVDGSLKKIILITQNPNR